MNMFRPATREKTKARVLLAGPSGSGKTRVALEIAHVLGDRIAVIDTENRSASLYVGLNGISFDVCELQPPYTYAKYLQAMRACFGANAYDVLVVDSLTHVWHGEGGALETIDQKSNKFAGWKDITPEHNRLLSSISSSPIHIICSVRTKTAYVLEEQENSYGKKVQVPVKKGMAPMFRDGVEYEFSVQLDINLDHEVSVSKTRIAELDGAKFAPTELARIGEVLRAFHETGVVPQKEINPKFQLYWFPKTKHTGKPIQQLETQSLTNYIARFEADKGPLQDPKWKEVASPYYQAALAELDRRQREEAAAAGADPETGEVQDDQDPAADPDDPRGTFLDEPGDTAA